MCSTFSFSSSPTSNHQRLSSPSYRLSTSTSPSIHATRCAPRGVCGVCVSSTPPRREHHTATHTPPAGLRGSDGWGTSPHNDTLPPRLPLHRLSDGGRHRTHTRGRMGRARTQWHHARGTCWVQPLGKMLSLLCRSSLQPFFIGAHLMKPKFIIYGPLML